MKKKYFAALIAVLLLITCIPFISGCNAALSFALKTSESGEKYYSVSYTGFAGSLKGELVIPEYYGEGENRAPVKEIPQSAFSGCNITSAVIPETVEIMGAAAFANCYRLQTAEFKGNADIPQGTFGYCKSLKEVILPREAEKIGFNAFIGCTSLESVTLPENLKSIDYGTFEGCTALSSCVLPQSLVSIGDKAFYGTALKEVIIPDTVNKLGYAAFHTCTALERVTVGTGVETLPSGVFGYCISLKEIRLPASLKAVEGVYVKDGTFYCGHAFHSDSALETVYYGGTEEEWNKVKIDGKEYVLKGVKYNNDALLNARKIFE